MTLDEQIIKSNREEIEKIVLTDQEKEEAILEKKLKIFFHLRNKPYWDEQENRNNTKASASIQPHVTGSSKNL